MEEPLAKLKAKELLEEGYDTVLDSDMDRVWLFSENEKLSGNFFIDLTDGQIKTTIINDPKEEKTVTEEINKRFGLGQLKHGYRKLEVYLDTIFKMYENRDEIEDRIEDGDEQPIITNEEF